MPLKTTAIGAYPKPSSVPVPDWFHAQVNAPTKDYNALIANPPAGFQATLDEATQSIVQQQVALGIDIPTDGELRRENYIYYQCRNFQGFDFENLTHVVMRNGAYADDVPTVRGPIRPGMPILPRDYLVAQAATSNPVKMTLPGPLTITGTTADAFYKNPARLGADLADALNREIMALVDAGCTWIQVDEPVFARNPDLALDFGFDNLERCFAGVPDSVQRVVHMCCGYPNYLDEVGYVKADRNAYFELAEAIDASSIDAISLEDAHANNDLALLDQFKNTTVIWGSITIASSRVETVEEIETRLNAALNHIDAERLMVAPDCGLGYLTDELVQAKLRNMSEAARRVG